LTCTEVLIVYRYETWSVTKSKDHKLRVFQRRMLMNVFDPKKKAVTEVWKRIVSQGAPLFVYPTSYFWRDPIKEAETGGACVAYREE
jgi:hypothetical protein